MVIFDPTVFVIFSHIVIFWPNGYDIYRQSPTFLSITKTIILVICMQIWTLLISPKNKDMKGDLMRPIDN